jgi:hypothetical protein
VGEKNARCFCVDSILADPYGCRGSLAVWRS